MNKVLSSVAMAAIIGLASAPALAAGGAQTGQWQQEPGMQQQGMQQQQQQLGAAPQQAVDENLVRDIQQQLQGQGYQLQVDGIYGPETRQALQQFQQQQGIQPHGQVGLETLAALGMMEDIQQAEVPQKQEQEQEQEQQQQEQQQQQQEQQQPQFEQQEQPRGFQD